MSPYTPIDQFSNIRTYDITDPVLGGGAGESNEPIEALADRTQYLFNRLGRLLGQRIITSSGAITTDDISKLLKVVTSANLALTLPSVADFPVGSLLKFKIKNTATANTGKSVSVTPAGSEVIEDGNRSYSVLDACDGEEFYLMAGDANSDNTADYWELLEPKGNFEFIGQDRLVRVLPRNCLIANGCNPESAGSLLSRADFSRLWAAVSGTAISDVTWQSSIRYQGFFSTGNGSTTFRVPDMRSMVHKGLDLSRALSLGRLDELVGGLEMDAVLSHDHPLSNIPLLKNDVDRGGGTSFFSLDDKDNSKRTGFTGGSENLVKTIGLIPVIFY